jgi:hypothetical protein
VYQDKENLPDDGISDATSIEVSNALAMFGIKKG